MTLPIRQHRDLRIDFFRGLALWFIFLDHLGHTWLRAITLKHVALCDSAELFVLLAGISAGMVYGSALTRHGLTYVWTRVLRRTFVIYRTHLIVFALFALEVVVIAARFNQPSYLKLIHIHPVTTAPFRSILEAATLRFQPRSMDILPLYVVLLLIFCLALPLLRWPKVLLTISAAIYVGSRLLHLNLPAWESAWYFNPLTWQLLFIIGVVSTSLIMKGAHSRWWDVSAWAVTLFCMVQAVTHYIPSKVPHWLVVDTAAIDKTGLHPFRLMSILALAWLTWRYVPATAKWLRSALASPLLLMGQHSLPVFCTTIFMSTLGEIWLADSTGLKSQVLVPAVGTLIMFLVALFYGLIRRKPKAVHHKPEELKYIPLVPVGDTRP
jgi:hypothetical protein